MSNQAPQAFQPAPASYGTSQAPGSPIQETPHPGAAKFGWPLLAVGVISLIVDIVAGNSAIAAINELQSEQVFGLSEFNVGTMYANLALILVVAVLAAMGGRGKGIRITGAILSILVGVGAVIGVILGGIMAGSVDLYAEFVGDIVAVPEWYYLAILVIGAAQLVAAILVTVKLFKRN